MRARRARQVARVRSKKFDRQVHHKIGVNAPSDGVRFEDKSFPRNERYCRRISYVAVRSDLENFGGAYEDVAGRRLQVFRAAAAYRHLRGG